MRNLFNRIIFEQVNLDSGALTMKSSIVHIVNEAGEYHGQVSKNNAIVGYFRLLVDEHFPDRQVSINLRELEESDSQQPKDSFTLSTRGFCVFYVADGAGGYAVNLSRADRRDTEKPFNSRELQEGDIFTATLIRPGVYTAVNQKNNTCAEIVIPYPKRATRKQLCKPVTLECLAKGISPEQVEVQAGCGLIFAVKTTARLVIELQKPIDRPEIYKQPEDVPRSVERKALAVLNSLRSTELLAAYVETGKGAEKNRQFAAKIMDKKQHTGRLTGIGQLLDLEKLDPEEYTSIINSLAEAYGKLTTRSKPDKSR